MIAWTLQQINFPLAALATAVSLIGLGLIYGAWRQKRRRPLVLSLGWGALVLSGLLWVPAAGFDKGPTIGIVVVMLMALGLVLGNGEWATRAPNKKPAKYSTPKAIAEASTDFSPRITSVFQRAFVAGPLAFSAVAGLAMVIIAFAPMSEANRIVTALCALILVWPVLMTWACTVQKLRSPVIASIIGIVFSGLVLPFAHFY